jgi:predicted nucleotidyltransferase
MLVKIGLDNMEFICFNINMDINIPVIDKIVPLIVSLVSPDQIVLFGSYARGENNEKSDIDLLIIKKGLKNGRELNNILYKAFFENNINIPIDLISIDYNKYNELNDKIGYIYKTIKEQGKILYGTV